MECVAHLSTMPVCGVLCCVNDCRFFAVVALEEGLGEGFKHMWQHVRSLSLLHYTFSGTYASSLAHTNSRITTLTHTRRLRCDVSWDMDEWF